MGLVPATPIKMARPVPSYRGRRAKPGDDRSFELCRDQARVLTKADTSRGLLNLRLNTITKGET